MSVIYNISLQPQSHIYDVELNFVATNVTAELYLPVWIPGSYMIREFSKNIIKLNVTQNNLQINQTQIRKNTWELSGLTIGEVVCIKYSVYAYEYGIRTAFLDSFRGYFNPTSLCVAISGYEDTHHQLNILNLPPNWSAACGLSDDSNVTTFIANNYDELIDNPVELSILKRYKFYVANTPHYLVLSGTILPFDSDRMIADIQKICEYQVNMFGGLAPYKHYTFILNLSGDVCTGLEHRNSTLLMASPCYMPNFARSNDTEYLKLLGLISHEFFHTWNVKRIKPKAFVPYNLKEENYTKLLWWFEGVTSYYDDLVMYRAGIYNKQQYLDVIVENLNRVYKFRGNQVQSVANSSLLAWTKYYRQDENSPNSVVSYYVKGALVALGLDLLIRKNSTGKFSLDDVLVHMYKLWQADNQYGVGENEVSQIILAATGVDVTDYIYLATETTADIDFAKIFADFGLDLFVTNGANHQAEGKYFANTKPEVVTNKVFDIGARVDKQALGYVVRNVYSGTPAEQSGLAANDLIIAINDVKLNNFEQQLAFYSYGEDVELSIFRKDNLIKLKLNLQHSKVMVQNLVLTDINKLLNWL